MEDSEPVAEPPGLDVRADDYVRGALEPEDAAKVEADAEKDSALAAEIAFLRSVKSALRNAAEGSRPKETGWARLSRAISRERRTPVAHRLSVLQAAGVAACAVALWHFIAVPLLQDSNRAAQRAAVSETVPAPSVQVTFSTSATEAAIRALLLEIDGVLADGPNAVGVYRLRFQSESARDKGLDILRNRREVIETARAS